MSTAHAHRTLTHLVRAGDAVFGPTNIVLSILATWHWAAGRVGTGLMVALWIAPALNYAWSVVTRHHDRARADLVRGVMNFPLGLYIYTAGDGVWNHLWLPALLFSVGVSLSVGIGTRRMTRGVLLAVAYAIGLVAVGGLEPAVIGDAVGLLVTNTIMSIVAAHLGRSLEDATQQRDDAREQRTRAEVALGELGERTHALTRAHADLQARTAEMSRILDNASDGLLIVDAEGAVCGRASAAAERWLGPLAAGSSLCDALQQRDPAFGVWFGMGWDALREGLLPLEVVLDQLPRLFRFDGRHIEVTVRPIGGDGGDGGGPDPDGRPASFLVVLSDTTEAVEHQRAEAAQRSLLAIFEQLLRDRAGVSEFFTEADALMQRIRGTEVDATTIEALRRDVHTLKGNCGLFGLDGVARACHELEDALEGDELVRPSAREQLAAAWDALWQRAQALLESRGGGMDVTPRDVAAVREAVGRGAPAPHVLAMLDRWQHPSVERRLERIGDHSAALARRLGKGEIRFIGEDHGLRLPAEPWAPFWSVLGHVIRNAVDHGLEPPEERRARGKDPAGTICVRTREAGGAVTIDVEDDGRGIDWDRIREVARARGLPAESHDDLVCALFADGVSSKAEASAVSGRGVGMAAVKACVEDMGGTVRVISRPGAGCTFRFEVAPPAEAAPQVRARAHA